jgi:hypothetical protein
MLRGITVCLLLATVVASFASRPERNAFIDYRISSIADLERQIKTDPAVADRYERHFGMTKSQLLAYVGSLHRDTLQVPATFEVYSIPPDGHVKMHMQRFNKGEPIFEDPSGRPVLLVRCGNPLTLGPEAANVVTNPAVEAAPAGQPNDTLRVTPFPGSFTTESPEMVLSTPTPPGDLVETPTLPETLTTPAVTPAEAPQTFSGGGGGLGNGWPIIPILGGIVWGIGGSGGHSHTPPVPEPAPVVGLMVGLVGIAGYKLKKRRN